MYETIKNSVESSIYTNSSNLITGNLLQQVLVSVIESVGANSGFMGLAVSGSGTAVDAGDVKSWLLCVNNTSNTISYPRYIPGTTTNLSAGGVAIIYNIGNGWEWRNICGNVGDTNSVLGKIASVLSSIGDNATAGTILYRLNVIESDHSAMNAAVVSHAVSRGVHLVISGSVGDEVLLVADGVEYDYCVLDGAVIDGASVSLEDSADHHAYILFDWRNVNVPNNVFLQLRHCKVVEFPSSIEQIEETGANNDELASMKWIFNNMTPPKTPDNGSQFSGFGGVYCHNAAKQDYTTSLSSAGTFTVISY